MKRAAVRRGPLVYCRWQGNRTGILLEEGPEQSRIVFDDEKEGFARDVFMINSWFVRGVPRVSTRVKLTRVRLK